MPVRQLVRDAAFTQSASATFHHSEPDADDRCLIVHVHATPREEGAVSRAPVLDRTKTFALRLSELPRHVTESAPLDTCDLDDGRHPIVITEENLPFTDFLDGLAFVHVVPLPERRSGDLRTCERKCSQTATQWTGAIREAPKHEARPLVATWAHLATRDRAADLPLGLCLIAVLSPDRVSGTGHHGFMTFEVHTASERPDLWARGIPSDLVWPEYNLHGDVLNTWWDLSMTNWPTSSSSSTTK